MGEKNKYIFAAVGFLIVMILGIFLVVRIRSFANKAPELNKEQIDKISLHTQEGGNLTVFRNGSVQYEIGNEIFTDNWTPQKTGVFFDYFETNYFEGEVTQQEEGSVTFSSATGGKTIKYNQDDELIDVIIDDVTGNDDEGDSNGEDIGDYFNSPTPLPNGQTPTPSPTPSAGGGSSECLYWKVSYCVIKRTPIPTPTPAPQEESVAVEPTCEVEENRETGRTVISNQLCIPTPTP